MLCQVSKCPVLEYSFWRKQTPQEGEMFDVLVKSVEEVTISFGWDLSWCYRLKDGQLWTIANYCYWGPPHGAVRDNLNDSGFEVL